MNTSSSGNQTEDEFNPNSLAQLKQQLAAVFVQQVMNKTSPLHNGQVTSTSCCSLISELSNGVRHDIMSV